MFKYLTYAAATIVVAAISLIAVYLIVQAIPAIGRDKVNFLTSSEWTTTPTDNMRFGVLDLLKVTLMTSVFGPGSGGPRVGGNCDIPGPVRAVAAVANLGHRHRFCWRRCRRSSTGCGASTRSDHGWNPLRVGSIKPSAGFFLFSTGNVSILSTTVFVAGIVLGIMILPIITSISRESLRQTPVAHQRRRSRWARRCGRRSGMTVLPYGRSGIIAGSMLALGRALGETVAVLVILGAATTPSSWSLFDGGYTFASKIASAANEFTNEISAGAYIAAGLVLFLLTFVVNALARTVAGGKVNG